MKIKFICIILLCLFSAQFASAQKKNKKDAGDGDSKKEAKIWKDKLSKMDPLEFKKLMENYDKAKKESSSFSKDISALTKEIQRKEAEIAAKEQEIADLEIKISKFKSESDDEKEEGNKVATTASGNNIKGLIFKVQIGAFQNLDLSKFKDNGVFFVQEEGNQKKYTLGVFRDYVQAHIFRRYIEKMGVKGPFVVAYKDGARIDDITKVVSKPFEESMMTESNTSNQTSEEPKKKRRKKTSEE
jgi:hypothetical protein